MPTSRNLFQIRLNILGRPNVGEGSFRYAYQPEGDGRLDDEYRGELAVADASFVVASAYGGGDENGEGCPVTCTVLF